MNMYMLNCTLKFQSVACMRLLLGAKSMPFGCMSMARLGAKYAEVGCKSMDTFGCMSMPFGCMSMARLGAGLTVGSLPDSR